MPTPSGDEQTTRPSLAPHDAEGRRLHRASEMAHAKFPPNPAFNFDGTPYQGGSSKFSKSPSSGFPQHTVQQLLAPSSFNVSESSNSQGTSQNTTQSTNPYASPNSGTFSKGTDNLLGPRGW